jgi:hypothetical protein
VIGIYRIEVESEIGGNSRCSETHAFEGRLDGILWSVAPDRKIVLGRGAEATERDEGLDAVQSGPRLNAWNRRSPGRELRGRRRMIGADGGAVALGLSRGRRRRTVVGVRLHLESIHGSTRRYRRRVRARPSHTAHDDEVWLALR